MKIMAEQLREARKRPVLTAPTQPVQSGVKPPVRRIDVHELMAGGREAVLLHDSEEYRLRLTSNGKLILTK
jgi:hemin uptake protein HemP